MKADIDLDIRQKSFASGLLPELIAGAGFEHVDEIDSFQTMFGSASVFRAGKKGTLKVEPHKKRAGDG